MASLTQTAIITRRIVRYSIYLVVFIVAARITILTGIKIFRFFFPEPPPPPTVSFGKLPSLPLPETQTANTLSYKLETPEGTLPEFPEQAKVYFIPRLAPNLLSVDKAKRVAAALNFSPEGKVVVETIYLFQHTKNPSTLTQNIATGVLSISYDVRSDPSLLESRPPSPEVAVSITKNYLASAGLLPEDLAGPTTHQFLKFQESGFVEVLSLSEAEFTKVNIFRKDYDGLPTVTTNPNEANVWFIVSGSGVREKQVIAGEYHYFSVNEEQVATYPIITSRAAWESLLSGNAFIISASTSQNSQVTIRKVYLAYFDPAVDFQFLEPVVVFEGDDGFVAYVPAVTKDYYGE